MKVYEKYRISSPFGLRDNPKDKGNQQYHRGLDFVPDKTNFVYPGFTGKIVKISHGQREGNFIQIYTKLDQAPFYINVFHLESASDFLKQNFFVRPNDVIGIAGSTGNTTGLHIHYEIFTYKIESRAVHNMRIECKCHVPPEESKKRMFFDPFMLYQYCERKKIFI